MRCCCWEEMARMKQEVNTFIIHAHAMISAVFSNAIIQILIALEHNQSQYLNGATDYAMFICCFEHIFNCWLDF